MRNHRTFIVIASLAFILLIDAGSAWAEGCPKKPVLENGGKHWCYDAGSQGHVHLWKPKDYDARRAATIVYVHGYNLTTDENQIYGSGTGEDGCPNLHYVDCAWDKHRLARQFSNSGLDALFVAVEGPSHDNQKPKWKSLDALMDSIRSEGDIKPPPRVTAVGHSAGIFTVVNFLADERLKQVVVLDALYTTAPCRLQDWYESAKYNRLTLVGAGANFTETAAFSKKLHCAALEGPTVPYSEAQRYARCVSVIDEDVKHMDVVRDGLIIPVVLTRTIIPPPPPKPHCKVPPRKPKHHQKVRHHPSHRHAGIPHSTQVAAVLRQSSWRVQPAAGRGQGDLFARRERSQQLRPPVRPAVGRSSLARHLRQRNAHQRQLRLRHGMRHGSRDRRRFRRRQD